VIQFANLYRTNSAMPLSIRLKPHLEQRVAQYAVQKGVSKSAVITRSVEEYLDRNTGPTLYEMYERIFATLPPEARETDPHTASSVRERYAAYARAKHARRARR